MGIPSYYKNTIQNYPEIIIRDNHFKENIDYLFLDLNCAIHPCCAGKTDINEMYISIFEKIKECISLTNVKTLVYIAIDGPAPRTKMEQQRQRRLKSSQENKIWDTNQITPGTGFMNNLSIYLNQQCKTLPIKYIISDSNERGEGEHKIMQYIEKLSSNKISVVYGLDADLIMLSMLRNNKIYLLRETTSYNIEQLDCPYVYCDINLLKKSVVSTIKKGFYRISNQCILYDYLFLCFFIGNDFIINTPCINIRYGGLDYLLDIYRKLQEFFNGMFYLIDDNKNICVDNFQYFVKELSLNEKDKISEINTIRKNQQKKYKRIYQNILNTYQPKTIEDINIKKIPIDIDKLDEIKNHSPVIFRDKEDLIFNEKMNKNYYMYNFYDTINYNPSYQMILKTDKDNLCQEYFKSILWTYYYYFHNCVNWRWYYQYHFAPLLSDFSEYCKTINAYKLDQYIEKNDNSYTPEQQLKIVLPLQENNYMYPLKTPLHSLMKRYYWECHPIMPHKL
jgi:5'-3' exonuclease